MKWSFGVCLLLLVLNGCNAASNNTNNSPSNADLEGNWEFLATSTTNPSVITVFEVSLNSTVGPSGSFSGGGELFQGQPTFYPYDCQGVFFDNQADPLTLTTSGSQVSGSLTDGSAVFNFTGQVSGQGTAGVQFSGTYSSAAGNPTGCQGDGTFVASPPVSLTGNYLGTSGYLTGASLSVTQTGGSVTVVLSGSGTYSGADTVVGNTAIVGGGSDPTLAIWWDTSAKTLWLWSQADGASGFTKQ